ncbi:MAG: nucleoside monophosphate kinase [Candidatus Woesearchaeota archaeon]
MKMLLLGPQASGKDTQAEKIEEHYNIKVISVGNILRKHIKNKTKYGVILGKYLKKGVLAPDDLTNKIVMDAIKNKRSFLLDGYPRDSYQAKFIVSEVNIDLVIVLRISEKESVKRITSRRVCAKCGENYNLITKKPGKTGVCDICKEKLVQRDDDKPAAVKTRLKIYRDSTAPSLKIYRQHKIPIACVNGEQKIECVWQDIKKAIDKFLKKTDSGK